MYHVNLTVVNPTAPNAAPRIETIPFASEWACKIMCDRYASCADVQSVEAVNQFTGEVIYQFGLKE